MTVTIHEIHILLENKKVHLNLAELLHWFALVCLRTDELQVMANGQLFQAWNFSRSRICPQLTNDEVLPTRPLSSYEGYTIGVVASIKDQHVPWNPGDQYLNVARFFVRHRTAVNPNGEAMSAAVEEQEQECMRTLGHKDLVL